MSLNSKKSIRCGALLMMLGLAALFAGTNWLVVLIPVAILVWHATAPSLRSSRH